MASLNHESAFNVTIASLFGLTLMIGKRYEYSAVGIERNKIKEIPKSDKNKQNCESLPKVLKPFKQI